MPRLPWCGSYTNDTSFCSSIYCTKDLLCLVCCLLDMSRHTVLLYVALNHHLSAFLYSQLVSVCTIKRAKRIYEKLMETSRLLWNFPRKNRSMYKLTFFMPKVSVETVTLFFCFSPCLFTVDMPHISIYHHRTTLPNIASGVLTHVPWFSTLGNMEL